jgi:hypothetical protein
MGIRHRGLRREAVWLLALPAYQAFLTLAAWRALLELPQRPFHWAKTRHGLARSSRRKKPA